MGQDRGMLAKPRPLYALAGLVAFTSVGLCVVDAILTGANNPTLDVNWLQSAVPHLLTGSLYGIVGALILARRPDNRIGWLFCGVGLLFPLESFAEQYAHLGLLTAPGSLPGAAAMAWLQSWLLWLFWPGTIVYLLLLFPTGRPPSRRWWPVAWATALFAITMVVESLISPGRFNDVMRSNGVISHWFPATNPFGFKPLDDLLHVPSTLARIGTYALILLAAFGAVRRFRRSTSVERQQLKWLAYAGAVIFAGVVVLITSGQQNGRVEIALDIILVGTLIGIPVGAGVAILKYHLYDIDLVINKSLVYGALAIFITVVYVAIVVGLGSVIGTSGRPNLALSIVATAIVAVAFQPIRERLQRVANRLVYGTRATPYEVLSQFSDRVASTYAGDEILPRMARVLAEGTGAARADVWLRIDDHIAPAVSWPPEDGAVPERITLTGPLLPSIPTLTRLVPVRQYGELLGALSINKRPGEAVTPVEDDLLKNLAAQAGLVLRNVRLTAELRAKLEEISRQAVELRASRQRIVAAQDAERRRLERNIHDGAQQNLVALAVKLRLASTMAKRDPQRALISVKALEVESDQALETLRALARGIYPPLLREQGLATALRAEAERMPLQVAVSADHLDRYPAEVEAAVYFVCLEALQNITKHARASRVEISLRSLASELSFEVTDDGAGFDVAKDAGGSGLRNMIDRIEGMGGRLVIRSDANHGTTVEGSVPIGAMEPVS
jgi:signal transduction histidine kinase